MFLPHSPKPKLAAIAAALLAAGIGGGWVNWHFEYIRLGRAALREAAIAGAGFDRPDLLALTGTASDVNAPAYGRAKRVLRSLIGAGTRIRRAYVFRTPRDRRPAVLLADSSAPGSKGELLPGAAYPDAAASPALREFVRTGRPALDPPAWGDPDPRATIVAGVGGDGSGPADAVAALAVELSADHWNRELWASAFRGALYVWILTGLPLLAVGVTRRQGQQREAIRNLSEAIEQSHSAIMILDLEQRIEYANRGLCEQIGYRRRELIGRRWRELLVGRTPDATVTDLVATIRSGRPWEGEWTNQRKDGTFYPARGMVTPVKHRDGALACYVAIFDDATDAKRREAEMREARDLAEAGDRAKGQFLATMSHEVRTPLNGIVGFTSLLMETALSNEQREYVQTIRSSGEALIRLTGDILDFARIESGKLKLDPAACDPRECIEEVLDLHAAKAEEKRIVLLHSAADDVPAAVVIDEGRLRQVLVNLLGNAVKFTETGEVEITLRTVAIETEDGVEAADGDAGRAIGREACVLEFKIRDTGIGIPAAHHARLFKPFSQIDESSTRRYGGAGLGLAISRNLVQLMGGEIIMESEQGKGTTFTFTVRAPVAAPQPPRRQLDGLRVGLSMQPGSLRREFVVLLGSWGADVWETDARDGLAEARIDVALVELSLAETPDPHAEVQAVPGLPLDRTFGLVPITLGNEARSILRRQFRLLVNLPVHHGPLFATLSGSRPSGDDALQLQPAQLGLRVLIVEDNPINQRLLQRVLTGLGCTWMVASNGREAMTHLTDGGSPFDIVLMDLHMPEMDGISALERIRRGEAGPQAQGIWVIAITADARPEQRTRGFEAGLNDFLTKPLRVADLESALRRYLSETLVRKKPAIGTDGKETS